MSESITAIIPARGGSRRIARKNVRPLEGQPVILRVIQLLQNSGIFDRICVSTDDPEITELSQAAGCEVPFLRTAELSSDIASIVEVVVDFYQRAAKAEDISCVVFPTCALLNQAKLLEGSNRFLSGRYNFVMGVAAFESSPLRSWIEQEPGVISLSMPQYLDTRTQDLPRSFYDCGQMYWSRLEGWQTFRNPLGLRMGYVEFKKNEFVDVDTEEDWAELERLFAEQSS